MPERTWRAFRPCPTSWGSTWAAGPLGQRMLTGPSLMRSASRNITGSSWNDDGANTVMFGTRSASAMS